MLCSAKELKDFHPAARDGEIGRVRDLLFDDQRWGIRATSSSTPAAGCPAVTC